MQNSKIIRVEWVDGFQVLGTVVLAAVLAATATAHAQTFTTLVNFDNNHGAGPDGGLVQGRNGNLYGTASSGGASGNGTVLRMTPKGTMAVLHSFDLTDGD